MISGAGLQSLGQSLDPTRLSQAMLNFQELEKKKKEQQLFTQQLAAYEHQKKKGDPDVAKLFAQGEKYNPNWGSSFKDFQNHKASMSMAADSIKDLKSQAEALGISPEEMDMHMKLIMANPRQAPNIVNRVLNEKFAIEKQTASRIIATDKIKAYEAGKITGRQAIARQAIDDKLHITNPDAFAELVKLAQFSEEPVAPTGSGEVTRDDLAKTIGFQMLVKEGIIDPNNVDQSLLDPEVLKRLSEAEKIGDARLIYDEIQFAQKSASERSKILLKRNERALEEQGVKVSVNGKNVVEATDEEKVFKLNLPGTKDKLDVSIEGVNDLGEKVFIKYRGYDIAPHSDGGFFVMKNSSQIDAEKIPEQKNLLDLIATDIEEGKGFKDVGTVGALVSGRLLKPIEANFLGELNEIDEAVSKLDASLSPEQTIILDRAQEMAQEIRDTFFVSRGGEGIKKRYALKKEYEKDYQSLAKAKLGILKANAVIAQSLLEVMADNTEDATLMPSQAPLFQ